MMGGVRLYMLALIAVLLSGLAAMLPLAWSGADVLASSSREAVIRELGSEARLITLAMAPGAGGAAAYTGLLDAARDASGTRYTLINPDGTVLADSDEDPERMENHANRPEVAAALAGEIGMDSRKSPTLGTDWMYVAVPFADGRVIRAAASLADINLRLGLWWRRTVSACAAALAILVVMAFLVSRMLSRPIEAAALGAERYAAGELSYRLPVSGAAEMRRLASAMGEMAAQLEARFALVGRQKREMSVIFENMSEGLLAVDDNGKVLLLNAAAQTLLPIAPEAAGVQIENVIRNADLLDAIRETALANTSVEREIRAEREGEPELLIQIHTARIRDESKAVGVLIVMRDVTALRRLEMVRRDFVANVSHELRTPITSIMSCLETLQDDAEPGQPNAEFLEMAIRNTRRMGGIIDNLLFLAGMEAGVDLAATRSGATPVLPVLNEAVAICKENSRGQACVTVDADETLTARINPQLVTHAIVNLVDNALKYGPEDGAVHVSATRDGDQVRVVVSDQGPGIAPKYQSRVFERFYRIDGSSRVKKGAGLGLAIVKHIALAQDGDVQLRSEVGVGSTFILSLPGA